jgi:integrase
LTSKATEIPISLASCAYGILDERDASEVHEGRPQERFALSTSLIHFGKYKPDAFRSDALRCPSAKNVDPKIVQDTLGHASLSMTLGVYSHVQAAMKDEAAAAMDSTFS